MNRTWILGAALLAALGLGGYVQRMSERVELLETAPRVPPGRVAQLEVELAAVRQAAERARAAAADRSAEQQLSRQLDEIAAKGERTGEEIELFARRLESWEGVWQGHAPESFDSRLGELRKEIEQRTSDLDQLAAQAERLAREDGDRLEQLQRQVEPLTRGRDVTSMWKELLGPVVQLAGDSTVGSGVLLESRPRPEGGFLTHVLTSWHVVRDIYGSPERTESPVPVKIYLPEGGARLETAHMVVYDVSLDIALLTLDSSNPVPFGARLASRERVHSVHTFDPIYAVGCPLGNDPIPTPGEIAATNHLVEGGSYWMISAPTYIGNSGGGIFDARTHELLGIFSKIYIHGSLRTTIVPHMGLATPLSLVYAWFDEVGQSQVVDGQAPRPVDGAPQPASASRD